MNNRSNKPRAPRQAPPLVEHRAGAFAPAPIASRSRRSPLTRIDWIATLASVTTGGILTALAVVILLLAGCGIPEAPDSYAKKYPWNGEYSGITARGIYVNVGGQVNDFVDPPELEALLDQVDALWSEVQDCTAIYLDPDRPFVVDFQEFAPSGTNGFIYWVEDYAYTRIRLFDLVSGYQTTRHEMIHYLLYLSGDFPKGDVKHASPLFDSCRR